MKTKLTLSVDKDVVKAARHEARRDGKSVSKMFSDFVESKSKARRSIPRAKDMLGSLKGRTIDDSKSAIRSAYTRKYIR